MRSRFLLDLFWPVLRNTSQFFAFSIIVAVSYSCSPHPPSPKIHSSGFISQFQSLLLAPSPKNLIAGSLFQAALLSSNLSCFIPIIFVQLLQPNAVTPPLSPAIPSYAAAPVPICSPKPARTAYIPSLNQRSSFPHSSLLKSIFGQAGS